MPTEIVTTDDLREFKLDLIEEFKNILNQQARFLTKKWLKSTEVCELLGISTNTLQTFRINGEIPYTKIGGTLFYDSEQIQNVMAKNMQNGLRLGRRK